MSYYIFTLVIVIIMFSVWYASAHVLYQLSLDMFLCVHIFIDLHLSLIHSTDKSAFKTRNRYG